MEIIIPAAGSSTRFPNMRPKYLLTAYNGKPMIQESLEPYIGKYNIHVGVLREHYEKFHVQEIFDEAFSGSVNIVILDKKTKGPADTVYQIIKNSNITGPILVKDCDSFFNHKIVDGNVIYVDSLKNNPEIRIATNKSYVDVNDQMIVNNIVEKQIISEWFCVGGYQFQTAEDYVSAFMNISDSENEIYVSNVIDFMLETSNTFIAGKVSNWIDVGTKEDWYKYNNKPTIFCDIDGVLVKNQAPWGNNSYYDEVIPQEKTVNLLLQKQNNGCQIIFVTARREKYREVTKEMLDSLGFSQYILIMNLNHAKRVLINDYNNTNPYPSAIAINTKRDQDQLEELLNV